MIGVAVAGAVLPQAVCHHQPGWTVKQEHKVMSLPRALDGIRVVDFSWVRAGPWATRWLGALGAEIIKIEWPENERGRLPSTTTPQHLEVNLNTSGNFNDTNVNKKSLSLNVRSAKGLEIVKRLIAVSDIVIENFSSRVLQKWGLGHDELCKIKPDIVYVSMSGYGHTGRHHHYTTFGPVAQAVSGLTHLSGLPDRPPAGWGWSYMDDTGGMYGAMCALTGLYHRNVTGKGQHIDLSQMVASVPLAGPALLDFAVNGRGSRRAGFPPEDRVEQDPQLRHRQMFLPIEHAALGTHKVQNAPFKLSQTPASNHLPSPLIGEHTREIVEGLLGYSHEELCAGFANGTFWPTERPRFPYMEEMLR